jgi:hypothetical protein
MNATTKALPADRLRADVEVWLADHDHDPRRVRFYTPAEWAARGETMGDGATLHLNVEDSALCALVNYPEDYPGDAEADEQDFIDLLASRGYWYEIGFTWRLHFYPLEV